MFGNWISFQELLYLARKLQREPQRMNKLLSRLILGKTQKIKATWAEVKLPPIHWFHIPAVNERKNLMISGDKTIHYSDYILDKFFSNYCSIRALSLGCGSGSNELLWAKTNRFQSIDAYDISESRIQYANEVAKQNKLESVLHYMVGDANKMHIDENHYDLILCIQSLHHFSPLDILIPRIGRALKPEGFFVIDEFVGPTRFQWTACQLEAINGSIQMLPRKYKKAWESNYSKLPLVRPSKLSMILRDPSEAVESSKILPLLEKIFVPLELRGYGGTILHPLLYNISHNFVNCDDTGEKILQMCFDLEDLLLANKEITHDFVVGVYQKI